jgi:PAS domain S-box-containing protein
MKQLQSRALVLNVDDHAVGRYGKTRILEEAGFDVIEAGTGEDALKLVRSRRPQLVLLDIQLPDVDGLEVCRRIKGDPGTQHIPVLHISATYDELQGEPISMGSGADIFLAEPVEPLELITVVRTLLRLRTTEIGLAESEERMRLATEGAGIATWDIDLRTGVAHWNRQSYLILGYKPNGSATWDMWRSRVHPDDAEPLMAAIEEARNGAFFTREHRILRHDNGEERWLSPYGRIHLDEQGKATRFLGIAVDITERKHAEARRERLLQLEHRARSEAEQAARLKDEFLATLSHELRSPMSAILGWLHLLRSGRLETAEHARALDTIERNARLQNQLINDLLDVSRIVTGKLHLDPQPVALEGVLEQALNSVRLSASAKGVALEEDFESLGFTQGDADRLQQVFVNLLSNGIKFTPPGGRVQLRARRSGDWHKITVSDTGEGIEPDLVPHLFQRFTQADGSSTRRYGGLGLGLAIVRHLVELHGGRVTAESEGKGLGATFTVLLPATAEQAPMPDAPSAPVRVAAMRPLRLDNVRVLVVDDEPGAAHLMAHVLRMEGAEVRTASRASDAVAVASAWFPEALVLDIGMPDVDGYTLIGQLRAVASGTARRVPAIAVTGYASELDRKHALEAGFDVHFTKPFDVEKLLDVLVALLDAPGDAG